MSQMQNHPESSARVNRKVLVTDPEAVFSMQQRQAEALANMVGTESGRIDSLVQDMGVVRGTVEGVHAQMKGVAANVDKLTDAMAVLVRHEVNMERNAADVRAMQATQNTQDQRIQVLERKAPGLDELRVWVIRAGLGVVGMVGMAVLLLVMKSQGGA